MELGAANGAIGAADDAPTEQPLVFDTSLSVAAANATVDLEEDYNVQEKQEKTEEAPADEAQTEQPEQSEGQGSTEEATTATEVSQEEVEKTDPATSNGDGAAAEGADAQPSDVAAVCEGNEEDVAAAIESVEESATAVSDEKEQPAPADSSTDTEDNGESSSTVESAIVAVGTSTEGQESVEVAVVDGTETNAMSPPPAHEESEYDPSACLTVPSVPHGDDEYDPANPSPTGTPVASNHRPATEQEEYDPDHPSMTSAGEEPVAMEVDQASSSIEQTTVTPAKRKSVEDSAISSSAPVYRETDPKRPRYVTDSKGSPRDDDPKHGRHRRGSGDSTTSSSSKHKHHEEDHKGLSAAAWDRLMDFQTSGEFRVTQVSRAAFASVGAMPEFAQIAIIARFVRTPIREVRDKNGQLMRIYREYQKENPQVAALQPIDAFMSDYKSDPGLFRFGYAPPQPATGVSNVRVPYQRDQPEEVRHSPRPTKTTITRPEPEKRQPRGVDEFGRVVHHDKPSAHDTNGSAPANVPNRRSVADPRLAARSQQDPPSSSSQVMPRFGGKAEDPRRRDQPHPQSTGGAARDPRRRGTVPTQQPSPRGQPGVPRVASPSDIYERLPIAVKTVLNSMHREGRLQEPLNDNVMTRLLHLPEPVARQAVDNFSNVDLSQVGNLQGFLVGIINRVNEKAIAAEKQHRPLAPSPRGHPLSALPRGGEFSAPPQGGSVLGGPPQAGRMNGNNGANGGSYRGQPDPMASGPAITLYERPYEAPQDPRDPRRRQPAPQGPPQYGGAARGPPQAGPGRGPVVGIGMQSFTALPMSVQNHIHSLVVNRTLSSLEELGSKCYEVLGQLSEPLANQVVARFAGANLSNVRNKSGFLVGVVKRARQEYGFNG